MTRLNNHGLVPGALAGHTLSPSPMFSSGIVAVIVAMTLTLTSHARTTRQAPGEGVPQPARAADQHGTILGLVYTPDVLQALIARQPSLALPSRLRDAVRQQTPVVVMWDIPVAAELGPLARPLRMAVVSGNEDVFGGLSRVDPIWTEHDATGLMRLDPDRQFGHVGAVAAFPNTAFGPDRHVVIYSEVQTRDGAWRGVTRAGTVEWQVRQDRTGHEAELGSRRHVVGGR